MSTGHENPLTLDAIEAIAQAGKQFDADMQTAQLKYFIALNAVPGGADFLRRCFESKGLSTADVASALRGEFTPRITLALAGFGPGTTE